MVSHTKGETQLLAFGAGT